MAINRKPDFNTDNEMFGKLGERDFIEYCNERCTQVLDVSGELIYQLADIDFLVTKNKDVDLSRYLKDDGSGFVKHFIFSIGFKNREVIKVEVKCDTVSLTTRNIVFEIISHDGPGCCSLTKADFLYYVFIDDYKVKREAWIINLEKLRCFLRETVFGRLYENWIDSENAVRLNNFNKYGDKVANFLVNIDILEKNKIATKIFPIQNSTF